MLEQELKELVRTIQSQKCESNYTELKAAAEGCPKITDTLSAFSNQSGGGKIIFGVDERQDYAVCGVYDAADLQRKIMEQSMQMEPEVRPLCTVAVIDGKTVVCAEIQEIDHSQKPCFYKGKGRLRGSYVRVADGDRLMTEYEVYSYEAFRKKVQDELRDVPRAQKKHLETTDLARYMLELKSKKPKFADLSDEVLCELQGFTCDGAPTLAGIMLFSLYPQSFFPQLCMTAVSVPGTEMSVTGAVGERFIDNQKIEGTIPQMIDEALKFIRRNMKEATVIDPITGRRNDRTEYPMIAVRELVINSIVHRDYSIHTESAPITIRMYSDRMEIENPGGLYGRMTIDRLGQVSADTRNPLLANALEIMGVTENRYSGIPTVINAMKEYGLPAPVFTDDRGIFRATLYKAPPKPLVEHDDEIKEILAFCTQPRSRAELETLFAGRMTIAYVMTKYIHPMVDSGVLALTIPDKPKSKNQKYVAAK